MRRKADQAQGPCYRVGRRKRSSGKEREGVFRLIEQKPREEGF